MLNTDLGSKQASIKGGASTITDNNLAANRALISNASGKVAVSAVTATELGYLDGVTGNVQMQLNKLSGKIAAKHVTLTYSTNTVLRGYVHFEGRVTEAFACVEQNSGTPTAQVTSIVVQPGYGGTASRVEIYANGTGFVSGHVLDIFCMAFISV